MPPARRAAYPSAPTTEDLDGFRRSQQLAYRCAESIAAGLEPGVTESEAVARMRAWLDERGVEDWFHLPFAWFGDRTAFRGFRQPLQFFPTDRRLEENMAFILDCAPVFDGYTADIGYAGCIGTNAILARILADLAEHRALILEQVRERRPLRDVYESVERLALRQGHDNCHRRYPGAVIAHQVWRLPRGGSTHTVFRFGTRSLTTLGRTLAVAAHQGWSPLWNGPTRSDHPPVPGLWALEPHLGFRGVGAKFEELLVVTEDDAFWLDDDLPHVRRWAARGVSAPAGDTPAAVTS